MKRRVMTIKELRQQTGLSQARFAEYLNISIRTLQDWEQGKRTPPEYVTELIEYKLRNEGLIGKKDTKTVYVVTEGAYSDYQIQAIFSDCATAEKYCACHDLNCPVIEEWKIDYEEIQSKDEVLFQWCFEIDNYGKLCYATPPKYVYKSYALNYIDESYFRFKVYLALDTSITEEEALKIAADRLAIYKAEKEI